MTETFDASRGAAAGSGSGPLQFIEQLLAGDNDAVFAVDLGLRVVLWPTVMEALTGITRREALGAEVLRLLPGFAAAGGERDLRLALERRYVRGRARLFPAAGDGETVEASFLPLHVGDAVVGVVVVARDLTAHSDVAGLVRGLDSRFRAMADSAPVLLWMSGIDARCEFFNATWLEFTGRRLDEELGYGWAEGIHPEDVQSCLDGYLDAFKTRRPFELVYRLRRADGEFRSVLDKGVPRYTVDGAFAGYIGSCVDITDRIRAEEERAQMEVELRQVQKLDAVGRLAGGVAHEFNNLLTVILGRVELLLAEMRQEDPARGTLRVIGRMAERAADLTWQLLAFGRKQVLRPVALDLNVVVTRMSEILERLLGEDIELETVLHPALRRVTADPGQIEQVLLSLAVNARAAMPDGGRLTIETANALTDAAVGTGAAPREAVVLRVSDTGAGIDHEAQARLFEPFFAADDPGAGTGLGLAPVYGIVKQHGGTITVKSGPGHGTTFTIGLPAAGDAVTDEVVRAGAPITEAATVLLVEDEGAVRDFVREVLTAHGYTVLASGDGEAALALAAAHPGPIHLLITDVVMPRMSGRELVSTLVRRRPDVRVLYISGYSTTVLAKPGDADGARLLMKPFSIQALLDAVADVLGGPTPPGRG